MRGFNSLFLSAFQIINRCITFENPNKSINRRLYFRYDSLSYSGVKTQTGDLSWYAVRDEAVLLFICGQAQALRIQSIAGYT